MKKLFLLLLISFYSFTQTSFILDGTGSTSRNNLTLPGYALGITGTTTGPYGIKGTIGLLPITTSGTNITLTGISPVSVSGSNNNYSISSIAISTLTGSNAATVTGTNPTNVNVSITTIIGVTPVAISGSFPIFTITSSALTSYQNFIGINEIITGNGTANVTLTGLANPTITGTGGILTSGTIFNPTIDGSAFVRTLTGSGAAIVTAITNGYNVSVTSAIVNSTLGANMILASPYNSTGIMYPRTMDNYDLAQRNRNKNSVTGPLLVFGDSIDVGQGGTVPGINGFIYIVGAAMGVTVNNQAVSGRGAYIAGIASFTTIAPYYDTQTIINDFGFNDIRRNNSTVNLNLATAKKVIAADNSIFAQHFSKVSIAASTLSSSGTWGNFTPITTRSSGKLGGNARTSSVSGSTLSYTTPICTGIAIGTFGTDGIIKNYGQFSVSIDGTAMYVYTSVGVTDGISDGGTSDGSIIPDAIFINYLPNQAHVITIGTLENKVTPIDYISVLSEPQFTTPIFVGAMLKLTANGYTVGGANTPPNNYSNDAISNQMDSLRVININRNELYQYPIQFWDKNRDYVPLTCQSSDFIHPSNAGHSVLGTSFCKNTAPTSYTTRYLYQGNDDLSNVAHIGYGGTDSWAINGNRQFGTGISFNVLKSQAQIAVTTATTGSQVTFATSPTINTTPVTGLVFDKNGNLQILNNALIIGTTLSNVYKDLNASSTIASPLIVYPSGSSRTSGSVALLAAGGSYSLASSNGTDQIRLASFSFGLSGISTVAGSEFGNFGIYAKSSNSALNTYPLIEGTGTQRIGIVNTNPGSTLHVGGSFATQSSTIITNTTLGVNVHTIYVNGTTTSVIILPTILGILDREYLIKNISTITSTTIGIVLISTTGTALIDNGINTYSLTGSNQYVRLKATSTGWMIIDKSNVSFTYTLDFPSTSSGTTSDIIIGFPGALLNDNVEIGKSTAVVPASGNIYNYDAWVSANDLITLRFSNGNTINAIDPASGQFKITLLK